ncbi:MAG TPA: GAF and ANTAR domain-containing protein [Nocardioidaceae bacterium]|nr:GAF and ANTAR domain-containing protein [Nocardioidaceae bacterium]
MYNHSLFLQTLSGFTRTLLTPYDLDTVLGELAASLIGVLGLAGSGVTLASEGRLRTATAFPAHLVELEQIQQDAQLGPCAQAVQTGKVVAVADLRHGYAERWPEYCVIAARLGLVAVAGIPLRMQDETIGAFNMYDEKPRDWSDGDIAAAVVMADMATGFLINASKLHQQEQMTQQLQFALDSRVVIEQAKGAVATAHGVSIDEAFERIRRHARANNASVGAAASAIVNVGMRI